MNSVKVDKVKIGKFDLQFNTGYVGIWEQDVVQVAPYADDVYGGLVAIIDDVEETGCKAHLVLLNERTKVRKDVPLYLKWGTFEKCSEGLTWVDSEGPGPQDIIDSLRKTVAKNANRADLVKQEIKDLVL